MNYDNLSETLKIGRRAIDGINGVEILKDWRWDTKLKKWYIKIAIISDFIGIIPSYSIWYIVVDNNYPKGIVKIYPDALGDWTLTYKHQSNNGETEDNGLWRKGSLCLESPLKCLGKHDFNSEPLTANHRLLWNVKRAIDWVHAAINQELTEDNDLFELPEFKINTSIHYVFSEDEESFIEWNDMNEKFGIAELDVYKSDPSVYYVKKFLNVNKKTINETVWGEYLSQTFKKPIIALWIMLDEIPVINGWQAPNIFGELLDSFKKQNRDLLSIIKSLAHNIRDGNEHILLLGFPIPKKNCDENSIIHWQALKLPILSQSNAIELGSYEFTSRKKRKKSSNSKNNARGVRTHEHALWIMDRTKLNSKKKLIWLKSQNWNIKEITRRGKLNNDLSSMNILIIGAGAIGASVAELFARTGITDLSIIDYDKLEIGNLSRHPLDLIQIGQSKSHETAFYLNKVNPHNKFKPIIDIFEFSDKSFEEMNKFDLIIDCTGEDVVADELEQFEFEDNKIFISIFIGFAAKRLYLFLQEGKKFKSEDFREKTSYWLKKEEDEFSDYKFPREGTGCWSSIFPARYDDILLACSTTIKVIEDFITKDNLSTLISVYEQYSTNDGIFVGYRKIE